MTSFCAARYRLVQAVHSFHSPGGSVARQSCLSGASAVRMSEHVRDDQGLDLLNAFSAVTSGGVSTKGTR